MSGDRPGAPITREQAIAISDKVRADAEAARRAQPVDSTAIDGAPIGEQGYEYLLPGYGGGDGWQVWVPPLGWVDELQYGNDRDNATRRRKADVCAPRKPWDALDTSRMDDVVCPYCGFVDRDGWELFGGPTDSGEADNECYRCGKTYNVERLIEVVYTTTKLEEMA
jgi:DNA-directed RNA polymerase subunit RPC12/RpoP